jgi:hypothetical protein
VSHCPKNANQTKGMTDNLREQDRKMKISQVSIQIPQLGTVYVFRKRVTDLANEESIAKGKP